MDLLPFALKLLRLKNKLNGVKFSADVAKKQLVILNFVRCKLELLKKSRISDKTIKYVNGCPSSCGNQSESKDLISVFNQNVVRRTKLTDFMLSVSSSPYKLVYVSEIWLGEDI